jgi:hypothetical protein
MNSSRPLLSVSLDADNLWSYMKTHGDAGWDRYPSYLDALAEVALPALARHGLEITFFLVGKDASIAANHGALGEIARAGHEIANHSFHHEPWLHLYTRQEIETEIALAEEHIERATGHRTVGFRGPGFSVTRSVLDVLAARGYLYDATTLPTFIGPLARAYYFMASRGLSREERKDRSRLFGSVRDGLRPIRPYLWDLETTSLLEIPVTTMPLFRVPMHLSYVLYLYSFSPRAARAYLRSALWLCRTAGVEPSFLLHPLDFLGGDKVRGLDFFPAMNLSTSTKLGLFDEVIETMRRSFELVGMATHARAALSEPAAATRLVRPVWA